MEIRLNGRRLPDFEDLLQTPDGDLWLPLEPLVRAAEGEFLEIDQGDYRVALGVVAEDVRIDITAEQLQINSRAREWPQVGLRVENEQLFLDETQLDALFGLTATLTDDGLRVNVDSARPLPVDLRRMRERRWQRFEQGSAETTQRYREVSAPYALWGTPRGELRLSAAGSRSHSRIETRASGRLEVEAAYISNRVFFNLDDRDGLQTLRWTGGRTSPEGRAFGIDGLYRMEFGDVSSFSLPLVGRGGSGRGVSFSTAPLSRPDLFDVIRIEGDALPGWDAELYRGTELIDFQSIDADGRYDFDEVPLGYGGNTFRVMLYGPQGQVQESTIRRAIPSGQLLPGEWHMRGSMVQTNRPMVDLSNHRRDSGEQLNLRADFGLSARLTASALLGVDREPWSRHGRQQPGAPGMLDDAETPYLTRSHVGIAIRPTLGHTRSEWVVMHQDGGGTALQADAAWSLWDTSFSVGYHQYGAGFVTSKRAVGGRLFDSRLRVRSSRRIGDLGALNLGSLGVEYDRYNLSDGSHREEFGIRWRHRVAAVQAAHEVDHIRVRGQASTRYRFLGSYRNGPFSARGQLQAAGQGSSSLSVGSVSGVLDYRRDEHRNLGASASYNLSSGGWSVGARFSQRLAVGDLGLSTSVNDAGEWSAGLNLTVGFGQESPNRLSLMPPGHVGGGAAAIQVFEPNRTDLENGSDRDQPVPGVGFRVDGRPHTAVTDPDGLAVIRSLPIDRPVRIELDRDTLDDPFLTTESPRVRFQARPGYSFDLTMPLLDSAFVSGFVQQGEYRRPLAGVTVVARRKDGLAEASTRALGDGYFAFETLSPGEWTVKLDSGELPEGWSGSSHLLTLEAGQDVPDVILRAIPPALPQSP
ncbi:collagen binding domain-containing protein [Thioalkalivibrio sp. AKL12]|uniref:MSCRAMM family protein n=1 Tax=Thioalkalivibrio sp. AKL12 TaxID=1158159 RepID=UPI00039E6EB6|nr:carboxypeptidase-like regulatory domain-containing protein [Thioalkalivibrio sp. AKL12]